MKNDTIRKKMVAYGTRTVDTGHQIYFIYNVPNCQSLYPLPRNTDYRRRF